MKKRDSVLSDVERNIRELEIYTRRILSGTLVGDSRSATKGTGFDFDQIRDYQAGDDVRFIDWKATARSNKMLVKQYIQERSRSIILLVDVSASQHFGSGERIKKDTVSCAAGVLALIAGYAKDQIGLMLFSDSIECYIPPKQGMAHARAIVERIFSHVAQSRNTDINIPLESVMNRAPKNSIIFLISDFIHDIQEKRLAVVAQKFDLVAIKCTDTLEQEIPAVGILPIEDMETGQLHYIDARKQGSQYVNEFLTHFHQTQKELFKKYGVSCLELSPSRPYIHDIVQFLRYRIQY